MGTAAVQVQSVTNGYPVAVDYQFFAGGVGSAAVQIIQLGSGSQVIGTVTPGSTGNFQGFVVASVIGVPTVVASVIGTPTVVASVIGTPTFQPASTGQFQGFVVASIVGGGTTITGSVYVTQANTAAPFTVIVTSMAGGGSTIVGSVFATQAGSWQTTRGEMAAVVDSGNTTTTALGSGAIFTGSGVDLLRYAGAVVSIWADKPSETDGVRLEYSSTNSHWDHVLATTLAGSGSLSFNVTPNARYFRVVYQNGTSPQSFFRMATILKPAGFQFGGIAVTNAYVGSAATLNVNVLSSVAGGSTGSVWTTATSKGFYQYSGVAPEVNCLSITLASLADGTARQSRVVHNENPPFEDAHLMLQVYVASASQPSSLGVINVYALGNLGTGPGSTGTNMTDGGPVDSNAVFEPNNARLIAVLVANSKGMVVTAGPFGMAQAFGGNLPSQWAIGIENRTGAALHPTESLHVKHWTGVKPRNL